MKRIILVLIMMIVVVQAKDIDKCKIVYDMAHVLMENRQEGRSAVDMMRITKDSKFARILIIAAYKKPRYTTSRFKKKAIEDFSNKMYILCLDK